MFSKLLFFIGALASVTADTSSVDLVTFAGKDKSSTWSWKVLNDVRKFLNTFFFLFTRTHTHMLTKPNLMYYIYIVTAGDGRSIDVHLAYQ